MINEGKIPASSILVVTFSRAAATEMKERFLKFRGTEQKRSDFWNFPRNFLWDFESGLSSECGQYSFRGRKIEYSVRELRNMAQKMSQEGDFMWKKLPGKSVL